MKGRLWVYGGWWVGMVLSTLLLGIGIGQWVTGETLPPESGPALGLLAFNGLCFALAGILPKLRERWTDPVAAFGLLALKLFVNTFTIFLLIGLQACRTPVFVWQFFASYLWLLAGSILLLNQDP